MWCLTGKTCGYHRCCFSWLWFILYSARHSSYYVSSD